MRELQVLDVTLRDGGCVNNFNFGQLYMNKILAAQEAAEIDIIELGYIDEKNGSEKGRTKFVDEKVIAQHFLNNKKTKTQYVVMMDYGKFNVDNLGTRHQDGIDGIRLAFHKKNRFDIIAIGKKIIEKGYDLYIQPMITLSYSDDELLKLVNTVNSELTDARAFYIVDSFGEMRPNDMKRMLYLVDNNLVPQMKLGFHSHNNLQMSYSNAIEMLNFLSNRDFIIDSSVMGMGKGAGNLNTELLLEHLNMYYRKAYRIDPLLRLIDEVINQLHSEFYWGYAPEYYLSATNHCTPSYASYFYNKHMLPIDQVGELLSLIDEEKKISFDEIYAEELYRFYNASKTVDDKEVVLELKTIFENNTVLLIAPGKTVGKEVKRIKEYMKKNNVISIGLNPTLELAYDYVLTTRVDVYKKAVLSGWNIIVPSNISKGGRGNIKVVNYSNWIVVDDKTHDSSAVISLNLLKKCNVRRIILAGFDGFSIDINENYYDPYLRHPFNAEQVEEDNSFYREFISQLMREGITIEFLTPSRYKMDSNL